MNTSTIYPISSPLPLIQYHLSCLTHSPSQHYSTTTTSPSQHYSTTSLPSHHHPSVTTKTPPAHFHHQPHTNTNLSPSSATNSSKSSRILKRGYQKPLIKMVLCKVTFQKNFLVKGGNPAFVISSTVNIHLLHLNHWYEIISYNLYN